MIDIHTCVVNRHLIKIAPTNNQSKSNPQQSIKKALRDKKVLQALIVDSKDAPGYDVRTWLRD
jgi:hypothetical protein